MVVTRRTFLSYAVLGLVAGSPARTHADDFADIHRSALSSTAWVIGKKGAGASVVINTRDRLIITNYHVVQDQDDVQVVFPQAEGGRIIHDRDYYWKNWQRLAIAGKVIQRDAKRDLAVIRLSTLPRHVRALPFATTAPKAGDSLLRIGSPSAKGEPWKSTVAKVGWVRHHVNTFPSGQKVECRMINTDAFGRPGDSGGPVLNTKGELVGMHFAGHDDRRFSLAIDLSVTHEFVSR